jgi:cystathionine beta-lyase/cystathionine gamma-synthase
VEQFGVEKRLIRVSVGLEDVEVLKEVFERALEAV